MSKPQVDRVISILPKVTTTHRKMKAEVRTNNGGGVHLSKIPTDVGLAHGLTRITTISLTTFVLLKLRRIVCNTDVISCRKPDLEQIFRGLTVPKIGLTRAR